MAAVTTEHQVANLALGIIGQRQLLDSLDEPSTEAQMAKAFFASTRDELLQRWGWRFATKRVALALSTETRDEWGYCYVVPADYLPEAPARLWCGVREPGQGQPIPFALESTAAGDGLLLCTDLADAQLIYVYRHATVALWPPLFVKAVAAQLAVYLAGALPVKPQLMPHFESRALLAFQAAAAASANAVVRDEPAESETISVR